MDSGFISPKPLTPRQWNLYRHIKFCTETGRFNSQTNSYDHFANQESICKSWGTNIHEDGFVYLADSKHGDHCRSIWNDIQAINASPEVEKIIVVDNYTYRLGTDEECQRYFLWLKHKAVVLLKRAYIVYGKMSKDGQGKLISCQDNWIGEDSAARSFVDAFAGGGHKDGQ
jgi:hypothetical protein